VLLAYATLGAALGSAWVHVVVKAIVEVLVFYSDDAPMAPLAYATVWAAFASLPVAFFGLAGPVTTAARVENGAIATPTCMGGLAKAPLGDDPLLALGWKSKHHKRDRRTSRDAAPRSAAAAGDGSAAPRGRPRPPRR
jgi:hypothetical protein